MPANLAEPLALALRVVPRENGQQFTLQALWNGLVIHEREVERLRRNSKVELPIELVVEGVQGSSVDVAFDDFRLVRRKEQ